MRSLALLAVLALAASAASAADPIQSRTFPAAGVRQIVVATDGGAITLASVESSTIAVDVSPAALPGDGCRIAAQLDGAVLTLSARASGVLALFGGGRCAAGFIVSAPPRVEIKAASGSGSVVLGAFSGAADIKTGSGEITLHGPTGALTLRSGSGRIGGSAASPRMDVANGSGEVVLTGLTGLVSAETGSGSIFLFWKSAPASGTIAARTGSGGLTALLPGTTKLKTALKTGSGAVHDEFGNDATAPLELTFRSGSGGVMLRKAP